jgi:hypothetical protein
MSTVDNRYEISSPIPISKPIVIIVAPAEYLLYTYYTYIKLFSMFILLYIYQELFRITSNLKATTSHPLY